MTTPPTTGTEPDSSERNISVTLTLILQGLIVVGLALFIYRRDWENVFLTTIVLLLTLMPVLLWRRYRIVIPPEFQLIAVAFVFLSLFLGSAFDLYYKYWWWDDVLHTSSGFLLGIVGFLAMYVLNGTDRLPADLTPAFRCIFGVTFAVTLGVLWEIFEFAVDRLAPAINMQSGETGVVDTMHDLIVDTIGAIIVALMGYAYLKTGRYSFIADGVRGFVHKNPRLFGKRHRPGV